MIGDQHRRAVLLLVFATWLSACSGATGPAPQPSALSAYASKELTYLRNLGRSGEFSGSVLVAANGRILIRASLGFASVVKKTPNRPETRFRIGSIIKVFTATGIMLLVQD